MIKLKIGGVPEHFNLPWRDCAAGAPLRAAGVAIDWTDYPSGTGAMVADLNSGQLDVAVLLTEGAVAGRANGGRFEILSRYTESALIWGVHVAGASALGRVADLAGCRFAISRQGSGSHLMAYALAGREGWPADELRFVSVGGLDGAIEALAGGEADVFLWERFMTEPVVAAGRLRRIDELIAPWPAFVICASQAVLADAAVAVQQVIAAVLDTAHELRRAPDAVDRFARSYGLDAGRVSDWLARTEWAVRPGIAAADIRPAVELLKASGLIDAGARIPLPDVA